MNTETQVNGTRFECIIPILNVACLKTSLHYYTAVLGFTTDWGGDEDHMTMASVSRDGFAIMLCKGAQGQRGTGVWIGVEDVETLFREYSGTGAFVREAPTNYSWALEMKIEDPDGHVLRFGSESKENEPRLDRKDP